MVKPAGPYLDVLATRVRDQPAARRLPSQRRIPHDQIRRRRRLARRGGRMLESLTGIKRAGADMILT
jgi:delta-aminolevulinic acid dehydratase/porphobilinogen synthase